MLNHPDDKNILDLFKSSDTKELAFRLLVDKYGRKVYWSIRRLVNDHYTADDLVQEVFIKIWNKLHKFRGDSSLFTWIYRISINETLAHLKKENRRKQVIEDRENIDLLAAESQDIFTDGEVIEQKFRKALEMLPERQRLVFNMKYFDELTYDEISEITGVSVGGLKASYHHAVKKIEKFVPQL